MKDYIAKCEVCATYQKEQPKEPLICYKIPSHPWETVGSNMFHFEIKDYLCTVDYYSNYFEVDSRKDKAEITQVVKRQFERHGIPNRLVSDNGPPFNSFEFQHFAQSYNMEYVTSSPHYPQGNGKVENSINTAKNLLKKSKAKRLENNIPCLIEMEKYSLGRSCELSSRKDVWMSHSNTNTNHK